MVLDFEDGAAAPPLTGRPQCWKGSFSIYEYKSPLDLFYVSPGNVRHDLKGATPLFSPFPPFPSPLMAESEASWIEDKDLTSSPVATSPVATHEPQWADDVVPPSHKGRNLIVCFDGTGDKFDSDVSHINFRPHPVDN